MATKSIQTNIKRLPQINSAEAGDFLILETSEGTGIIDFKDIVMGLDQMEFEQTITDLVTNSIALSTSFIALSGDIYADLSQQIAGNVASFKNVSPLSSVQTFEGAGVSLPVNYIEANNISTQQTINAAATVSCGDTTVSQAASAFVFDSGTYKIRVDARVTSLCSAPTWMQIFLYQDTIPQQVLQTGSSFAATAADQVGNLFIDGYFYLCRTSQITIRANTVGRFNLGLPTRTIFATASASPTLSASMLHSLQLSSCNMSMVIEKVSDSAVPAINRLSITL